MARRIWRALLACALCLCFAHPAWAENSATLTFSDDGITETVAGSGYTVKGTALTISEPGVYELSGSCANGSVVVKGSLDNVVLILDDLNLAATDTAPIVVKKSSKVTIHLEASSTLTDSEDASTEETNSDFEGAAIKVKSGSAVTFCGEGTLTVNGSAKNGIKGAATSSLTFLQGTYNVSSANNGIAADGSVLISGGSYKITGDNDGVKAVPDADDADSAGDITITGGNFDIDVDGDGIQAEHALSISGGTFAIKTLDGYQSVSFDKETMSCKGLKASGDREDIENILTVTGGSFVLDTADDAVHSDEYLIVTGGSFDINTGDDGMHADTSLILGTEGATVDRDPYVAVANSYEGLEAGTVYLYSGSYHLTTSDDGINAAGGSSDGTNPGGGGDNFNPGGGMPGGGMRPFTDEETDQASLGAQAVSDYCIYVYGGNVYVNAYGDGLDSNGNIVLNGGTIEVWGQSAGDNEPIDCDGSVSIKGATVFAAGSRGMGYITPASGSQGYKASTGNISAGRVVSVKNGSDGSVVYQAEAPKAASYVFYSSPDANSSYALSVGTGSVSCSCGNMWTHSWDSGTTADGVTTYTCTACGATQTQSVLAGTDTSCEGHAVAGQDDNGDEDTTGGDTGTEAQVMYRLYNPNSGEHLYTASAQERDDVVAAGWQYEGEAWLAPVSSNTPVYRLYNSHEPLGDHHYTTDKDEYDYLVSIGWTGEGIGWYSDDAQGVGLHRLYNPNAYPMGLTGAHHYTTSTEEMEHLVSLGWQYEEYGWYGVAA